MDPLDHAETASYGSGKAQDAYRAAQKELIDQGKFEEAFEMDVNDVREKFGDKYDKAIEQARERAKELFEKWRTETK